MYDESSVQFSRPAPSQNPIPKPRDPNVVGQMRRSRHSGTTHVTAQDGREAQREYTPNQVFETIMWGHQSQDPKSMPGVSIFKLNSLGHPGTRRRVVANIPERMVITTLPREEIPTQTAQPQKNTNTNTKKQQKEQKLRKQQRSMEANGG